MKQLFIIIIISFLFIQNGFSQKSDDIKNRFIIKVMPLSIIDFTPRYRLGVEYVTDGRMAYGVDFGVGNSTINPMSSWRFGGDFWKENYEFFEVRPEIKFLFKNRKSHYFYSSVEFFYMQMESLLRDGHYEKENSNVEINFDKAIIHKQKYGMHLKVGINLIAFRHINFDFYGGVGFAVRTYNYTDIENPVVGTESIFVEWMPQSFLFEGTSVIPHLALGFKLGYTF